MGLEFHSLAHFGLDRGAEVFSRAFEDYFVKIAASPALLMYMARSDSVDLAASRVVVRDGQPVGAALIARRGWTTRLAGMALVPEARGQGVGRATMARLLAEARERRDRAMVLEVIEQNPAGVRLYEGCGFRRVRRLLGFSLDPRERPGAAPAGALCEVDLREVAAAVATHGEPDLPWQIASETIAHLTPPSAGFRLGPAWAAVANLATADPVFRTVVVERGHRGQGAATALLAAIVATHPEKAWRMSALWPEEWAGLFLAAGFKRTELSQWQMARELP